MTALYKKSSLVLFLWYAITNADICRSGLFGFFFFYHSYMWFFFLLFMLFWFCCLYVVSTHYVARSSTEQCIVKAEQEFQSISQPWTKAWCLILYTTDCEWSLLWNLCWTAWNWNLRIFCLPALNKSLSRASDCTICSAEAVCSQ